MNILVYTIFCLLISMLGTQQALAFQEWLSDDAEERKKQFRQVISSCAYNQRDHSEDDGLNTVVSLSVNMVDRGEYVTIVFNRHNLPIQPHALSGTKSVSVYTLFHDPKNQFKTGNFYAGLQTIFDLHDQHINQSPPSPLIETVSSLMVLDLPRTIYNLGPSGFVKFETSTSEPAVETLMERTRKTLRDLKDNLFTYWNLKVDGDE